MTNREFLTAVINGTVGENEIAFANAEIAKLDARNDKRRNTLSKEQIANEGLKAAILETIGNGSMVAADIAKACGVSTQKVSALCTLLFNDGKLTISDLKVKGKRAVKCYTVKVAE